MEAVERDDGADGHRDATVARVGRESALETWRSAIDKVIADGGPRMHLQPIVDFAAGDVGGYEALARFGGDGPGPDRWYARAHQVGLGCRLEATSVRAALARRSDLLVHQFLSVNLSPAALADPEVQDVLRDAAPLTGVVVELTEHDQMTRCPELEAGFDLVRELGGFIAIDDIGTGYAGLRWVLEVRPELVKLDREFIAGVDTDEARAIFIRFVGELADTLDSWLIAEGIETDGELQTIVALGVPLGQGYRLGRPAPVPSRLTDSVLGCIERSRGRAELGGNRIDALAEDAPTVVGSDPPNGPGPVVVVDEFHQPLAVLDGVDHRKAIVGPMRVKADEDVMGVVRRALTRPAEQRWSPLVVTDGEGRYRGLLRMERLVRALSDERSTP